MEVRLEVQLGHVKLEIFMGQLNTVAFIMSKFNSAAWAKKWRTVRISSFLRKFQGKL